MNKIKSLAATIREVKRIRSSGERAVLITGCFDVLHIGHIELFRFAKKRGGNVVVGLDSDESIKATKGESRPIHTFKQRANQLAELMSVDIVFRMDRRGGFADTDQATYLLNLTKKVNPNYLITNLAADTYWKEKEKRIKSIGGILIKDTRKRSSSSTSILEKLAA